MFVDVAQPAHLSNVDFVDISMNGTATYMARARCEPPGRPFIIITK